MRDRYRREIVGMQERVGTKRVFETLGTLARVPKVEDARELARASQDKPRAASIRPRKSGSRRLAPPSIRCGRRSSATLRMLTAR